MTETIQKSDSLSGEFETDLPAVSDDGAIILANLIANQNKILRMMLRQLDEINERLGYIGERIAEVKTPSWLRNGVQGTKK